MVMHPRQCAACMMWGLFPFARDGMCAGCVSWADRTAAGLCVRCRAVRHVDGDGLCRACVFAVRVEVGAGWEARFPAATQLLLGVEGLGRQGYDRLPRRSRGDAPPALSPPVEAEERDDPRICPPAVRGQLVLFPVTRRLSRADARRIDARHWPEESELARHAAVIATASGVGRSWEHMVMRKVRCALALRDTKGTDLVAEELLDQIRLPLTQTAREVLDRAGLLLPRVAPPVVARKVVARPVGGCRHCGSWGITKSLCHGCSSWKGNPGRHQEGTCGRCRRGSLPVHAREDLCRGCLGYVRELRLDNEGSFTQLTFAGPLAHRLSRQTGVLGYAQVKSSLSVRVRNRARMPTPGRPRKVSVHLVDPAQLPLFSLRRDWRLLGELPAEELPALTEQGRALVEMLAATFSQPVSPRRYAPRGAVVVLRTLLAWLGASAPVRESDVRDLSRVLMRGNTSTPRLLAFLTEHGLLGDVGESAAEQGADLPRTGSPSVLLLHEERRRCHQVRALEERIALLPEPMAGQIHAWVSVMRGEGRFPHLSAGYERIHRYLYILWPVLTDWANAGLDLRQITNDLARAALAARQGHQARGIHNALRSVFRALKQQRIVFTNPMTGLSLTTPVRLPAQLPSDRLHGALERLATPSARLIVAQVAIHGLIAVDVARLQLDDADLAHHTLAVRRRDGIHTAHHPAGPRLSYTGLRAPFERIGLKPREVWADRVLDEARQTADPVHLVRLFGLHPHTAVKYVHAAHPDKALPRIR
ncbi:hypothetical protein [Streptomyces sp. NPDC058653]|uniref:hypothetical protein n=1 Tax=Streptomyces sp. NPDC058653 TaxID=3346576 RepID=UPI00365D36A1